MQLSKTFFKYAVPPCICLAVLGIFWYKNYGPGGVDKAGTAIMKNNPELGGADFSFIQKTKPDYKKFASYSLPVIVDYGADYCPPCRVFYPIMQKANKEYAGKAFLKYIDIQKYREAVGDNVPIRYIPTQVFFNKQGKPFKPSKELAERIPFEIYYSKTTNEDVYTLHVGPLNEQELKDILKEMDVQ